MLETVHRLEELLQYYERFSRVATLMNRLMRGVHQRMPTAIPNEARVPWYEGKQFSQAHLLRGILLRSYDWGTSSPDFILDADGGTTAFHAYTSLLPAILMMWTRHSRRVWAIDANLGFMLENTSLEGVMWSDVPWPFESYAVTLEKPVIDEERGYTYDLVLMQRNPGVESEFGVMVLVAREIAQAMRIPDKTLNKMEKALEKGKLDKAVQIGVELEAAMKQAFKSHVLRGTSLVLSSEIPVLDSLRTSYLNRRDKALSEQGAIVPPELREVSQYFTTGKYQHYVPEEHHFTFIDQALRQVLGMVFLITNKRQQSVAMPHAPASPTAFVGKGSAITNETMVMQVVSTGLLTGEERDALHGTGGGLHQLSAHWRKGHWRRRPGQGSDPDAPRCVWVKPTLIRAERLPDGGIPLGLKQSV